MKTFIYFFLLIVSINCQEESIIVNARYYPKSNTLEFNGQKYIVNTSLLNENLEPIRPSKAHREELEENNRSVPFSGAFWFNLIVFVTLACFAGTMSGLNI